METTIYLNIACVLVKYYDKISHLIFKKKKPLRIMKKNEKFKLLYTKRRIVVNNTYMYIVISLML